MGRHTKIAHSVNELQSYLGQRQQDGQEPLQIDGQEPLEIDER